MKHVESITLILKLDLKLLCDYRYAYIRVYLYICLYTLKQLDKQQIMLIKRQFLKVVHYLLAA